MYSFGIRGQPVEAYPMYGSRIEPLSTRVQRCPYLKSSIQREASWLYMSKISSTNLGIRKCFQFSFWCPGSFFPVFCFPHCRVYFFSFLSLEHDSRVFFRNLRKGLSRLVVRLQYLRPWERPVPSAFELQVRNKFVLWLQVFHWTSEHQVIYFNFNLFPLKYGAVL